MVIVITQGARTLYSHVTRSKKRISDRDQALAHSKALRSNFFFGGYAIELRQNVHDASTTAAMLAAEKNWREA